mgnify:CR=1 FL=1
MGMPEGVDDTEWYLLTRLAGHTHVVVSGLCLLAPGWEVVDRFSTLPTAAGDGFFQTVLRRTGPARA